MSSSNNGFIDLRVGTGARGIGDDSVWPSFTDIMTVIVMIFLMALVVMIARNFELDRQLVSTEISRAAGLAENRGLQGKINALETSVLGLEQSLNLSQGARDVLRTQLLEELKRIASLATDNLTLEEQLSEIIRARNQLAQEKQQLADESGARIAALTTSEADLSRRMAKLSDAFDALKLRSDDEIKTLSGSNLSLTQQLNKVGAQLAQVKSLLQTEQQQRRALGLQVESQAAEISAKQELLAQLQLTQSQSTQSYMQALTQIDQLNESIHRRQLENAALQKLSDTSGERFRSLQEEYDSLDAKYRTLARPARNPAGKHVVSVRIIKSDDKATSDGDDQYQFRLQEPLQSDAADYTRVELDKRLAELREKQGNNLYTKIIIPDIPENSGMSHNEAWRITQEILQAYDYYHQ